jgi:hypothetical protein
MNFRPKDENETLSANTKYQPQRMLHPHAVDGEPSAHYSLRWKHGIVKVRIEAFEFLFLILPKMATLHGISDSVPRPQDAGPPLLTVNPPVLNILVADPNLALEQSLGSSQSLSLAYVGAVGRGLLRSTVLNPASAGNPNFDFVFLTDNSATSNYNALQLKFQRRSTKGLQALAPYTFSHSIDI